MILDNEDRIQKIIFGDIGFYNQVTLLDDLYTAICRLEDDAGQYAVFLCESQNQHLTEESKAILFPNEMEYLIWEQSICGDISTAIQSIMNEPTGLRCK